MGRPLVTATLARLVWRAVALGIRSAVMAHARNGGRQRRSAGLYTVDDLAERTGLTPRTIRSYQTQGLLPPPDRHGRVAYYGESHLDRLDEITELKEEGLSLASIQDVLARRKAAARAKASKAKARPKARAPAEPIGSKPDGPRGVTTATPLRANGAVTPGTSVGTGMAHVPPPVTAHDSTATAKATAEDSPPPRRRPGLLASLIFGLLLTVAAVSSVVAVFSLNDAAEDRKRLGRQVSDLQSDLSRLDGNQGVPATVVVPGPTQPAPAPSAPPAETGPATRTVVVQSPRQPDAPSPSPPATAPPAAPPSTQPCTLGLLGRCLP